MWVGRTPGHIPRYMGQTSNNNNRFQLLIPVTPAMHVVIPVLYFPFDFHMICNSDSIRLDIRWHEITVYGWGFPCLDYSFDVLVSWDRDLSVYNHFCLWSALSWIFLFHGYYVIPVHIYFTYVLTLLSPVLDSCVPPGSPPGFVSYSPGEFHWLPWILMSRYWSVWIPTLLIRVAQR